MPFDRGHALLIGIGSYPNASYNPVPTLERDVDAIAAALARPDGCGYPASQVRVLKGVQATRAAVLAELARLSTLKPEHTVTIYLTCHGERDANQSYQLITHDAQWLNGKVKDGTALRDSELIGELRKVPAKRLLLIVNACSSGRLSPVLGADEATPAESDGEALLGAPLPLPAAHAAMATGEGRIIIAATHESQPSFVGTGRLTPFAQALVDGLEGRTTYPRDGYISAFELYEAVYAGVAAWLPKLVTRKILEEYGGKQEPELTVLKLRGSYAVALWQGAETHALGDFADEPPTDLPVQEVDERQSKRALQAMLASTAGRDAVAASAGRDAAVAQDEATVIQGNTGPTTVQQSKGTDFGSGNTYGDISIGDVAGRDIHKGTYGPGTIISPSGPVEQTFGDKRTIHADTYTENRNQGPVTHVGGDQTTISGGSGIFNLKSTLTDVTQSIGPARGGDQAKWDELKALLEQLGQALAKVPAERAEAAEAVAAMARQAVDEVKKERPNKMIARAFADGLVGAARGLAGVADDAVTLAARVAAAIVAAL